MQMMKIRLGKQARGLTLFHDQLMLIIIAGHELSHTLSFALQCTFFGAPLVGGTGNGYK